MVAKKAIAPCRSSNAAVSMVERHRRCAAHRREPDAGPDECVAPPLLGPEEHMAVDMAPPEVGAPGKAAGQCRQQPVIAHQLRPQDGGAALAKIDALKPVAVCAATRQIGNTTQLRRRQQTGLGQPGARAIRLDDVPDTRIASGETRRAVSQAIPSTSIME